VTIEQKVVTKSHRTLGYDKTMTGDDKDHMERLKQKNIPICITNKKNVT
jgi:hypothetical protein